MYHIQENTKILKTNIMNLSEIREELEIELNNISADPKTIEIYAHELGFISEGEGLIRLAGFSGDISKNLYTGDIIIPSKPSYIPEWICRLAGMVSGLIVLLFSLILKQGKRIQTRSDKQLIRTREAWQVSQ